MLSDIEIAKQSKMVKISELIEKLNIDEDDVDYYGKYKAKLNLSLYDKLSDKKEGKLILVSAISPTPLGEGKSTTTIGLTDAMNKLNYNTLAALREPSLGPVFGVKGGAAGGGYAQVNPMADLNLHFTGDLHAMTSANNLISACIDNHIHQGNLLNIDPENIRWERCLDLNDRALRQVVVGCGPKSNGVERKDRFNITVASEIMAILCLAKDLKDLRRRIEDIIVGYTYDKKVVTVKDLGIAGSVVVLLKDAMNPNVIQTLENNPVLVHGGPFANIAHGCNSIVATKMALKLADYVVTEAGFGADLGAEKFLDIKCREAGLKVSAVVIVATIKALKYHGNVKMKDIQEENIEALEKGFMNLVKHVDTIQKFGIPFVIALNKYHNDTENELNTFNKLASEYNFPVALSEVFAKGGEGGIELAKQVVASINEPHTPNYMYDLTDTIENKINLIAKNVYGAKDVVFSEYAKEQLIELENSKYKDFYICMAKTPLSLTDNPKLVGRPQDFTISIKEIKISAGARFLVCLTGDIMTMPGLPKEPLANKIDLNELNEIINLS